MSIAINLKNIRDYINKMEQEYFRTPGSVTLLAVSKTQSIECMHEAISAEQNDFGENYLQEALSKITILAGNKKLNWHFIGAIQSNKTKLIAQHFSWVHSIDNLHHAERLSAQRPSHLPALNICIQVNVDKETTKAGITLEEIPQLASAISKLPNLKLRGLFAIPAPRTDFVEQRKPFAQLRQALENLQQKGFEVDTLSMGMSNDYKAAIAEGATTVRLGTAIFGERKK